MTHPYRTSVRARAATTVCALCVPCRVIIWIGCVLTTVGYGGMYAMVSGHMVECFSRMILYAVVAGER